MPFVQGIPFHQQGIESVVFVGAHIQQLRVLQKNPGSLSKLFGGFIEHNGRLGGDVPAKHYIAAHRGKMGGAKQKFMLDLKLVYRMVDDVDTGQYELAAIGTAFPKSR